MKRTVGLYLDDILESIKRIEKTTAGITKEKFDEDIDIQDAVMRRIEIIGEAVKQMPQDFKDTHAEVPWRKIAGARDVFIHAYMEINLDRVWNIVQNDLSPLKKQIEALLSFEAKM
jgi:uncharacterized protein with HEPN domain